MWRGGPERGRNWHIAKKTEENKSKKRIKKTFQDKLRRKDEQTGRRRKEYFHEFFTPAWGRMREGHRWLGQEREGGWGLMRGTVSERCPRGVESLAGCLESKIFFSIQIQMGREWPQDLWLHVLACVDQAGGRGVWWLVWGKGCLPDTLGWLEWQPQNLSPFRLRTLWLGPEVG